MQNGKKIIYIFCVPTRKDKVKLLKTWNQICFRVWFKRRWLHFATKTYCSDQMKLLWIPSFNQQERCFECWEMLMSLSVGLGVQAAVGQYSLFMLAQSINSQFVCTIWSHVPNLFYLFHHLEITLVQRWEKRDFNILKVSTLNPFYCCVWNRVKPLNFYWNSNRFGPACCSCSSDCLP